MGETDAVESLLGFIHFLSLAAWVGGLLVMFLVVTPTVFRILSDDLAQTLDHHLLVAYYNLAAAAAVGALVSLGAAGLREPVSWLWLRLGLIVAMTALTVVAGWGLQPRIEKIFHGIAEFDPRDSGVVQGRRLARLQRWTWQLNGAVLLLGLLAIWLSVGGPRV